MSEGNAPGGKAARAGFHFQDAMVLLRLLQDALDRRAATALGQLEQAPLIVRIEATASSDSDAALAVGQQALEQPSWDSVYITSTHTIIDESKISGLDKEDRFTFYKRIRQTIAGKPQTVFHSRITVEKGTKGLEPWKQLASHALTALPLYASRVDDAEKLASEALNALTIEPLVYEQKDKPSELTRGDSLTLKAARKVLQNFQLDDSHTTESVQSELKTLLTDIGAEN